jgi:hypothetical protein
MHEIQDSLELADLQRTGIGFISTARDAGVKLHCAGCRAVGKVVTATSPKYHFQTYTEAVRWLEQKYMWNPCGICSPTND